MVISFSVKEVRDHLLNNGFVYTTRKNRRKQIGRTWWTKKRGQPKEGDVEITEIGDFYVRELTPYVKESGFKSLGTWGDAIAVTNRWKRKGILGVPQRAYIKIWLYKVTLKRSNGSET